MTLFNYLMWWSQGHSIELIEVVELKTINFDSVKLGTPLIYLIGGVKDSLIFEKSLVG